MTMPKETPSQSLFLPECGISRRCGCVAMVVSGTDDYTGRFDDYVRHVAEHNSIGVLEAENPITYVTAWDAAEFLNFIGAKSDFVGPINGANSDYLSIQELCYELGDCLNTTSLFQVGLILGRY
jgi:hypothetical protein